MTTEGFLFDLDGVVIDSERYRDKVIIDLLRGYGHSYDRDRLKPRISGKSSLECMKVIRKEYNLPYSAQKLDNQRRTKIQELYRNIIPFVPGFENFFSQLGEEFPLPIAIATGCDADYYELIDARLELTNLFQDHIYRGDMVDQGKPSPDIYLYAAAQLGLDAASCVAFEDAPLGIASAIRAGARVVAITRTFDENLLKSHTENELHELLGNRVIFIPNYSKRSLDTVFDFVR
jgi:beta-phosphoglucomutase